MTLNLKKGANINLTKTAPNMNLVLVGLGWDARKTSGESFDLDASAFLLNAAGKCRGEADFIFYGQLKSPEGAVEHTGDNRTGAGDGDDEKLLVDLSRIPADVDKIVFTVSIYDAEKRHQNFGSVSNAFIRVVDRSDNNEVTRYDLTEEASSNTAMIFAELYRYQGEWKFRAVGQGFEGGLAALASSYGLTVS